MRALVIAIVVVGAACHEWDALSERRACSGGSPSRCSGDDLELCDGFEADEPDDRWQIVTIRGSLESSTECAFRGESALEVEIAPVADTEDGRGDVTLTDGVPSPEVYLRMFVRVPEELPANGIKLARISEATAPSDGVVLHLDDGVLSVNNTVLNDEIVSTRGLTPDAWSCVELHVVEGTPGQYRVFVDDELVPELDRAEDTAPVSGAPLSRVSVGVVGFLAVEDQDAYTLYVDEVAIAATRIGCDR